MINEDTKSQIEQQIVQQDLQSFDSDLPRPWAARARNVSAIEPVGNIVWGYSTSKWNSIHGLPFAVTPAGHMLLRQLANKI